MFCTFLVNIKFLFFLLNFKMSRSSTSAVIATVFMVLCITVIFCIVIYLRACIIESFCDRETEDPAGDDEVAVAQWTVEAGYAKYNEDGDIKLSPNTEYTAPFKIETTLRFDESGDVGVSASGSVADTVTDTVALTGEQSTSEL